MAFCAEMMVLILMAICRCVHTCKASIHIIQDSCVSAVKWCSLSENLKSEHVASLKQFYCSLHVYYGNFITTCITLYGVICRCDLRSALSKVFTNLQIN